LLHSEEAPELKLSENDMDAADALCAPAPTHNAPILASAKTALRPKPCLVFIFKNSCQQSPQVARASAWLRSAHATSDPEARTSLSPEMGMPVTFSPDFRLPREFAGF
jgi:hypothetical protein